MTDVALPPEIINPLTAPLPPGIDNPGNYPIEAFFRQYVQRIALAVRANIARGMDNTTLARIQNLTPQGRPGEPGVRANYPAARKLQGLQVRENWRILIDSYTPLDPVATGDTTILVGGLYNPHPGGQMLLLGTYRSWMIAPNPAYGDAKALRLLGKSDSALSAIRRSPVGQKFSIFHQARTRVQGSTGGGGVFRPFVRRQGQAPNEAFAQKIADIFAKRNQEVAADAYSTLDYRRTTTVTAARAFGWDVTDAGGPTS